MKRILLITLTMLVLSKPIFAQTITLGTPQEKDLISNFMRFSQQQLYDTGNYFLFKNSIDTALICYGLIVNTPEKNAGVKQQERIIHAFIRIAHIYSNMGDYLNAYKYLIDALLLCEKYNIEYEQAMIYNNLGNIYVHFCKYDVAKTYYHKALSLCKDTTALDLVFNNLGYIEFFNGKTDSAFYFLDKSLQICEHYNRRNLTIALDSKGSLYQKIKQYDSAFYYYNLSLHEARKNTVIEHKLAETTTLSNLGNLFFELGKTDSALFYIGLSNTIAQENNYLKNLADNYLTLSKIEESRGRTKSALENFKKYAQLNDSVFSAEIFGDINQLQRYYEVSKTNKQIEQLVFEQQMKERTIYFQRIIWSITSFILILVTIGLVYIYFQKKNLSRAYEVLVKKNIEIIELQDNSLEKRAEKYKNIVLNDNKQNEFVEKILLIMEDRATICDTEFSLAKLAVLLQCNHVYVSQVINTVFKKNFRLFLNEYRIKEAQRLFSASDAGKYKIEAVANEVGFKSPNAFRRAFTEITGVSPSFYLNSMLKAKG